MKSLIIATATALAFLAPSITMAHPQSAPHEKKIVKKHHGNQYGKRSALKKRRGAVIVKPGRVIYRYNKGRHPRVIRHRIVKKRYVPYHRYYTTYPYDYYYPGNHYVGTWPFSSSLHFVIHIK